MTESEIITSPEAGKHMDSGISEAVRVPEETDDDSLIRWMLSLTPTRRLEVAQGFVDSVMVLRDGQATA